MSRRWYSFTGGPGDEYTPNKYRFLPNPPTGCNVGYNICSIYAVYGGATPGQAILGSHLETYISSVLANGVDQPLVGPPYYVYSKTP